MRRKPCRLQHHWIAAARHVNSSSESGLRCFSSWQVMKKKRSESTRRRKRDMGRIIADDAEGRTAEFENSKLCATRLSETAVMSSRQVEAEAVALLCCESLGLPGAEYSRSYIQSLGPGPGHQRAPDSASSTPQIKSSEPDAHNPSG